MAFPKPLRPERKMPAFYLMVAGGLFVAVFLYAVWLYSAPAEVQENIQTLNANEVSSTTTTETGAQVLKDDASRDAQQTGQEKVANEPPKATSVKPNSDGDGGGNADKALEDEVQKQVKQTEQEARQDDQFALHDVVTETSQESETSTNKKTENAAKLPDELPTGAELATEKEVATTWGTQAEESKDEKATIQNAATSHDSSKDSNPDSSKEAPVAALSDGEQDAKEAKNYRWSMCPWEGAEDYIPCLDNKQAVDRLPTHSHYEHRERHCPSEKDLYKCLLPLPKSYKIPIRWPQSRDEVWFHNVPHQGLVSYKKDQNWVKKSGNKLLFPGGGTQFKNGALHYIDFIQLVMPDIAWGKHTRVLLDVGCGVASFGGYLFEKDVITMSFAPKDEHEAQVQLALERGIPAFSAVMGTQRLVFPSNVFDVVHCARCRVPWHVDDGMLLLELNRVLRPGGFFVWSATPVYLKEEEDKQIWKDTIAVAANISWNLLAKRRDPTTGIGVAIFQKPKDNVLYDQRKDSNPPFCEDDNADAAWYVPMKACIHRIPTGDDARSSWPADWPLRVEATPAWLSNSVNGLYGKPAAEDFRTDTDHWKHVIDKSYITVLDWTVLRNIMDMKAGYGGFAAALIAQPVWVMNIVPTSEPDTLPIIFNRGLIGMYHDWCEPHSTYPRSYDLLHADHLFSSIMEKCSIVNLAIEMDRILRPDGWAIFRDKTHVLKKVEEIMRSMHWEVSLSYSKDEEELLVMQKKLWRPEATL